MKTAILFPGQGAQYPGMGKDFAESFSVARQTFEEADDTLKIHLSKVIFNGPEKELIKTHVCQTAIFVTSVAILRTVASLYPSIRVDMTAGLSLGEYTALHAAGNLSFKDALHLVQKRGELMGLACEKTKGTMAVILGLSAEEVEKIVVQAHLPNDLFAANFNCPGQVVISGTIKGVEKGCSLCLQAGAKRALNLNVHGAFHSGLMQWAQNELKPWILNASVQMGKRPVVMNVPGDVVKEPEAIKQELIAQVTHPVRWEMGIRKMDALGMERYIEMGPGKTLSGFNKRILPASEALSIQTVKDLEVLS